MKLSVYSPEKTLFEGEVLSISAPGVEGRFEVLDHHAALLSILKEGEFVFKNDNEQRINIKGGFINVIRNQVTACIEEW